MKAVIAYILFFTLCLSGVNNHAHANVHNAKHGFSATDNTVDKQLPEANTFIDVEDDDDDKDIAKKVTFLSKWITVVNGVFLVDDNANTSCHSSLLNVTGAGRCIAHRVLRI